MKLNSIVNKSFNSLTQDQIFEKEYLNYLKQLSKEEDLNLMSEIAEPQLFKINEISSIKENLIYNKRQLLEQHFPIKNGFDEIFNSLNNLDSKIAKLEKQLCIGENDNGIEDEELQNQRKDYFQDKHRIQLNSLDFSYPKQNVEEKKQSYNRYRRTHLINAQILQFSDDLYQQSSFQFYNGQKQQIQFHMQGESLNGTGLLVKLDQSLNALKKQLQNVKMFTMNLQNMNKKTTFLSLLRYLISIKSNILCIQEVESRTRNKNIAKKKGLKNSETFELLDEAYQICLKNRNLQSLEITSFNSIAFESFLSAMTNVDLTFSNICFLSLKIKDINVEQQQLCTFFSCLNELQYLQHLTLNNLNISEQETINSMNQVLKKQKYLNIQISYLTDSVDLNFNFEQAQYLYLEIDLAESQLTKKQQLNLFSSLCQTKHLTYIKLNVYHDQGQSNAEEQQQQKNNLASNQQENKKIKGVSQKVNKINNQSYSKKQKKGKVTKETENSSKEDFEIKDEDLLKFQDTCNLLEFYDVQIKYNPLMLKILLLQLKNSQHLKEMEVNFRKYKNQKAYENYQETKEENNKNKQQPKQEAEQEELEMDLQDLTRNLKNCQKLNLFKLNHECINFEYFRIVKDIDLYSLILQIMPKDSQHKQALLFKNQFNFDFEKIKRVNITSPYDIDDLIIIDKLCKSFSNSPKVESIKLKLFDDYSTKICREKQNFDYGNIKFFNRLANLKYLENLYLDIPINQNILDSLTNLLSDNQNLKCLSFSRNLYYYQPDTDYTKFFQAIKKCQSLSLIDLDLQIEKINIYQQVCLDNYEQLKVNLFYQPFSDFILSAKRRTLYVNYHEEILNKQSYFMILSSLKSQKEVIYFTFEEKILKQLCKESELDKLLQKCIQKGKITKAHQFPYQIYFN
ncbi:hypothetical protein ABPG72_006705 [Tetrahymena utriculariae]